MTQMRALLVKILQTSVFRGQISPSTGCAKGKFARTMDACVGIY